MKYIAKRIKLGEKYLQITYLTKDLYQNILRTVNTIVRKNPIFK
jgi:hypothetical protein